MSDRFIEDGGVSHSEALRAMVAVKPVKKKPRRRYRNGNKNEPHALTDVSYV